MKLAKPLAQFLDALHKLPIPVGAPPDLIRRLDVEYRWPKTHAHLCKIEKLGLFPPIQALFSLLDGLKNKRDNPGKQALCHGDLYARHLLLNSESQLCGIIDWGDTHVGNPAMDLAILFLFFPPEARKIFLENYPPIDEKTRDLALFRALYSASVFTVFSHDTHDADLLREALLALNFILEL